MLDNRVEASGQNSHAAMRDIVINNYALNNDLVVAGINQKINEINRQVMSALPNGIFSKKTNGYIKFDSEILLTSLLEIAIPLRVALDLMELVPRKIAETIEESGETLIVTTGDIRRIIYQAICTSDYSKYGKQIQNWGENYARRYGNPHVQMYVIKNNNEEIPLSYDLIREELLPALFEKCYGKDLTTDLNLLESGKVVHTCATEILQAVRGLNLYHIRYGTLHKIAYDLATQLPHPWFTNFQFKQRHLEYHLRHASKHQDYISSGSKITHSIEECIEHSCSLLLTEYELFIGTGKLRPLFTLIRYLDAESGKANPILWEQSGIEKIKGDLNSFEVGFNLLRFKKLLTDIRGHVNQLNSKAEEEVRSIATHASKLFEIASRIHENTVRLRSLKQMKFQSVSDLRSAMEFVLSFFERIGYDKGKSFFNHNYEGEEMRSLSHRIRVGYILSSDFENHFTPPKCEYSDVFIYVSDLELLEVQKEKMRIIANSAFVIFTTIEVLSDIAQNKNRYTKLIAFFAEKAR